MLCMYYLVGWWQFSSERISLLMFDLVGSELNIKLDCTLHNAINGLLMFYFFSYNANLHASCYVELVSMFRKVPMEAPNDYLLTWHGVWLATDVMAYQVITRGWGSEKLIHGLSHRASSSPLSLFFFIWVPLCSRSLLDVLISPLVNIIVIINAEVFGFFFSEFTRIYFIYIFINCKKNSSYTKKTIEPFIVTAKRHCLERPWCFAVAAFYCWDINSGNARSLDVTLSYQFIKAEFSSYILDWCILHWNE